MPRFLCSLFTFTHKGLNRGVFSSAALLHCRSALASNSDLAIFKRPPHTCLSEHDKILLAPTIADTTLNFHIGHLALSMAHSLLSQPILVKPYPSRCAIQLSHGALFSVRFPVTHIGAKLRDHGCAVVRLAYMAFAQEWRLQNAIPVQCIPAATATLLCATEPFNREIRCLALGVGTPAIPILLKTRPSWDTSGTGLTHHSSLRIALHAALYAPLSLH